ncbi:MAG: DUF1109 family protein [Alphaproteobacteria bacterium]|nr:DUF1109 family protein [Alphaproteobacteria bacterium]
MTATDALIEQLAGAAKPVGRLRPPPVRAALWLAAVAVIGVATILLFSNLHVFARRVQDPKLVLELIGTLFTGIAGVVAAFYLSLPDRSRSWALLPLPPLALWIAASGYNCYRHWITYGPDGWQIGESAHCFVFILGVSAPLGAALYFVVRKAHPLDPVATAALGGAGVAGLAAFLLQFFHPFDVTFMDLGIHLAAVLVVTVVALFSGAISRKA